MFRQIIGARTTLGQMYLNGEYVGYTLEDTLRPFPLKVYGETAIHEGMYLCEKYNSSKFGECLAVQCGEGVGGGGGVSAARVAERFRWDERSAQ